MNERLPPVPQADYSPAQSAAHAEFLASRKVDFTGPWHVFIRSPEMLTRAQHMGAFLRYNCSLSGRLSELAILIVARFWTQDYEWGAHRKHALTAGVSPETITAIAAARRPPDLPADVAASLAGFDAALDDVEAALAPYCAAAKLTALAQKLSPLGSARLNCSLHWASCCCCRGGPSMPTLFAMRRCCWCAR